MTLAATNPTLFFALSEAVKLLFVFAFGACVGSLTNVLVYRLPLGLSVVSPPSRCPRCGTRLAWKDNIPVLGWVLLRGRCRYCKVGISPEYPLVEAFVGLVFVLAFGLCYLTDNPLFHDARLLGTSLEVMRPDWSRAGFVKTWPVFVTLLVLLSCLVAMYLIDARTYTIPLVLTWTPAVTAAILLPLHAAWSLGHIRPTTFAPGWSYAIPTPGPRGWTWIGASLGGVLGIGLAVLLLRFNLLKRSFADYDEWEAAHLGAESAVTNSPGPSAPAPVDPAPAGSAAQVTDAGQPVADATGPNVVAPTDPEAARRRWVIGVCVGACAALGAVLWPRFGWIPLGGLLAGAVLGPAVAGLLLRASGGAKPVPADVPGTAEDDSPAADWLEYPHARREVIREVLFLAPCFALALMGATLARHFAGPWTLDSFMRLTPASHAPLWLDALAGVCMGYLIGGGVVWAVRILGSLLFGKEAMGLGDVHMMAGVGACLGWIDPTLAFFLAAFVGVYREVVSRLLAGPARRAMPFGPSLALATVLVLAGKPWIEQAINAWAKLDAERRLHLP
ncbi:MAG: A24 family peptidase [Phycisphaerales bacterium]|nr:A24 family peptidase [Phycisphaerales bacterium]